MFPFFHPFLLVSLLPSAAALALARWGAAHALGMRGIRLFFRGAIENPEARAPWRRALVVVAGLVASYLVSAVVFFAGFLAGGGGEMLTTVRVLPDRPAAQAGMTTGDRVRSIAGRDVDTWDELAKAVSAHAGEPVEVVVDRGGESVRFTVTPQGAPGKGKIGVSPTGPTRPVGGVAALGRALVSPARVLVDIVKGAVETISGKMEGELVGPAGVVAEAGKAADVGAGPALFFIAAWLAYVWPLTALLAIASFPRLPRASAGARR